MNYNIFSARSDQDELFVNERNTSRYPHTEEIRGRRSRAGRIDRFEPLDNAVAIQRANTARSTSSTPLTFDSEPFSEVKQERLARELEQKRNAVQITSGVTPLLRNITQAGLEYQGLAEILQTNSAALAGSSVLHPVLESINYPGIDSWKPNDFDFWILPNPEKYADPVEAFHAFFVSSGYRLVTTIGAVDELKPDSLFHYTRLKNWIGKIHVYRKFNSLIQVMVLRPYHFSNEDQQRHATTIQDAVQSFDLTICQYWWSGDNYIQAFQATVSPTLELSPGALEQSLTEWIRTFQRALKYEQRGFPADWNSFTRAVLLSASGFLNKTFDTYPGAVDQHIPAVKRVFEILNRLLADSANAHMIFLFLNTETYNFLDPAVSPYNRRRTSRALYEPITNKNGIVVVDTNTGAIVHPFYVRVVTYAIPEQPNRADRRRQRGAIEYDNLYSRRQINEEEDQIPQEEKQPSIEQSPFERLRNSNSSPYPLPTNWRNQPAEHLIQNATDRSRYNQGQCFDFINASPEQIETHLSEDSDNIVILSPAAGEADVFANAVCSTREQMRNNLASPENATLPCAGPEGRFPVDTHLIFIRINLREFPVYVPIFDVQQALDTSLNIFQVTPTELQLPTTASVDAVVNQNFVSADHCQAGTMKRIFRLNPIEFDDLPTYR